MREGGRHGTTVTVAKEHKTQTALKCAKEHVSSKLARYCRLRACCTSTLCFLPCQRPHAAGAHEAVVRGGLLDPVLVRGTVQVGRQPRRRRRALVLAVEEPQVPGPRARRGCAAALNPDDRFLLAARRHQGHDEVRHAGGRQRERHVGIERDGDGREDRAVPHAQRLPRRESRARQVDDGPLPVVLQKTVLGDDGLLDADSLAGLDRVDEDLVHHSCRHGGYLNGRNFLLVLFPWDLRTGLLKDFAELGLLIARSRSLKNPRMAASTQLVPQPSRLSVY